MMTNVELTGGMDLNFLCFDICIKVMIFSFKVLDINEIGIF